MEARRRVAAIATTTLSTVIFAGLLAGPASANPVTDLRCKKAGTNEIIIEDSAIPTNAASPPVGLINLSNTLNNVLTDITALNVANFEDIRIEDVKLIENFNLLTSASTAASCR